VADPSTIRAKARAISIDARRRAAVWLPDGLSTHANRLRDIIGAWLIAEVAPGRLLPWLPIAFGCGIALYFTAEREPAWWAACCLAVVTIAIAIIARRRSVGFPLALGVAALATGFCIITLHTLRIAHRPHCRARAQF
jgi:competence protein ComEC